MKEKVLDWLSKYEDVLIARKIHGKSRIGDLFILNMVQNWKDRLLGIKPYKIDKETETLLKKAECLLTELETIYGVKR